MRTLEALCLVSCLVWCYLQCKVYQGSVTTNKPTAMRCIGTRRRRAPGASMAALQGWVLWTILTTSLATTRWTTSHELGYSVGSNGGTQTVVVGHPLGATERVATCHPRNPFPQPRSRWLGVTTWERPLRTPWNCWSMRRDWDPAGQPARPRGWSTGGSRRSPPQAP